MGTSRVPTVCHRMTFSRINRKVYGRSWVRKVEFHRSHPIEDSELTKGRVILEQHITLPRTLTKHHASCIMLEKRKFFHAIWGSRKGKQERVASRVACCRTKDHGCESFSAVIATAVTVKFFRRVAVVRSYKVSHSLNPFRSSNYICESRDPKSTDLNMSATRSSRD